VGSSRAFITCFKNKSIILLLRVEVPQVHLANSEMSNDAGRIVERRLPCSITAPDMCIPTHISWNDNNIICIYSIDARHFVTYLSMVNICFGTVHFVVIA